MLKAALALLVVVAAVVVLVRLVESRLAFFPLPGESLTPRQFGVDYQSLSIETTDGVRRGLLPFPPLPALLLVPFVAVWGITTDDQTLFTLLAAVDVAICWWMLGGLRIGLVVRLGTTLFFAFGTVFWYAASSMSSAGPK